MDNNSNTKPRRFHMTPEGGRWAIYESGRGGERQLNNLRFDTATEILRLSATEGWTPAQADEIISFGPDSLGCECEQDWNCPLHGGTDRPTWIETRYQGFDDDEERYFAGVLG